MLGNEIKVENVLGGSDGVVYMMFLGRKTYTEKIQVPLVKSGFYAHKESVNQAVSRLTKKEHGDKFLTFVEKKKRPGKPKIYTAHMIPIFTTLRNANVEFDEKKFEKVFNAFSFLNDDFPRYLVKRFGDVRGFQKKLRWNHILAQYLYYLAVFHFFLYHYERTATAKEKQKLNRLVSAALKEFKVQPQVTMILNEKMEKFIDKYPGGKFSFVREVILAMQSGAMKLMFGSSAEKFIVASRSLTRVINSLI